MSLIGRVLRPTFCVAAIAVFFAAAARPVGPARADGTAPTQACPAPPPPGPPAASNAQPTGGLAPAPQQLLACIGATPITGATFAHWARIAKLASTGGGGTGTTAPGASVTAELAGETMDFLISSYWVIDEASELGLRVSQRTVRRRFDHLRAGAFPHRGEFRRFLHASGETVADVLFRVRLNLLSARIQRTVADRQRTSAGRQRALERFIRTFHAKWQARTSCAPAYAVPDCGHVQEPL